MTVQGPNNAKQLTRWQKIRRESLGMGAAEFSSAVASLGAVAVVGIAEDLVPEVTTSITKSMAKHIYEPYLDYVENTLGYVCRLKECQPDKTKSRQERAENLARATMLFVPAFVTSWIAKIGTRKLMNRWTKVDPERSIPIPRKWWELHKLLSPKDWLIVGLDEGVHVGSILMINAGIPKVSDGIMRSAEGMFENWGFSKQKSKDLASMLVIWELPNALGLASGLAGVYAHHTYGVGNASHVAKLLNSSSLNPPHTPPGH